MPVHYGIYMPFSDKTTTILPISIDLLGYRKRPFVSLVWTSYLVKLKANDTLSPWFMAWDEDTGAGSLLDVFKGFPLLVVNDAKIILPHAFGSVGVTTDTQIRRTWDDDMTVYPLY
jgi:hypothetical protein